MNFHCQVGTSWIVKGEVNKRSKCTIQGWTLHRVYININSIYIDKYTIWQVPSTSLYIVVKHLQLEKTTASTRKIVLIFYCQNLFSLLPQRGYV